MIQWMIGQAAPDAVLNLISCSCARRCLASDCSCMLNGLKCTIVCRLQNCCNMAQKADVEKQDTGDSDSDSEDDN